MRPILIDTNAYTAFKLADADVVNVIKHAERIAISPIVLGELLGFGLGNRARTNREELQQFLASPRVTIFPLTEDSANFYSKVYVGLKKRGNPIPVNDMWIAAQALENGCALCTYDRHFSHVDGLLTGTTCSELMI